MPAKGQHLSEEARQKISKANKGIPRPYMKGNLGSWATKGFKWPRPRSEENRENVRQALLGKPLSEERKRKISEATKGRVPWNKGKQHSAETKLKIGAKSKGRVAAPESYHQGALKRLGEHNPAWIDGRTSLPGYYAAASRKWKVRKLGNGGSHTMEQ